MTQPPNDPLPEPAEWLGATAVKQCRHGCFRFFRQDVYVGRSLELYGEFSESEVALFGQLLKPGAVVVEAGANIGALTVPIARLVGPRGRVIAYEPQLPVADLLARNVAANALTTVDVRCAALGAHLSTISVPRLDYRRSGNFGGVALGGEAGERIAVETIDSLGLERVDLIKVDVEGMEVEVLTGGAATIGTRRPVLYVENDRAEHSRQLIATLEGFGYRAWWHFAGLFNPANFFGNPENVFPSMMSVNLLCFPREWSMTVTDGIPVLGPDDDWESARRRALP
ncbi:MAG TPA: FkbM family methyltransferase [Candidatus Sulfotelmatobacter sp.]|nr:FkbM family methyltransferase [Candidatus Sulfotelmatobacter sp.]